MNKPDFGATPTLASAFEHFLDQALFARRTRESYTDDLAPLLTPYGHAHVSVLTPELVQEYLARQERLAPATYNRRLAALRSFLNFLRAQGWQTSELLADVERKPERTRETRALDAGRVESVLRQITDPRDRALLWLIYDGGLRCQEALAIDLEDISWPDRSIVIHGKGGRQRDMFFSRAVGTLLDKYLLTRGSPRSGPLFVTHRKARLPRRADLTPDGYARLSYRQADTLWKQYTPDWDLHQLRHTAISVRAAHDYTEVDLKRFSGHTSLRSLERYIADNREAAKRKAREWERRHREIDHRPCPVLMRRRTSSSKLRPPNGNAASCTRHGSLSETWPSSTPPANRRSSRFWSCSKPSNTPGLGTSPF